MNDEELEQNLGAEEISKKEKLAYKTFENREDFEKFINEVKAKFTPELKSKLEKEAK